MINKDKKHRLMIQVTKNQYKWLSKKAENLGISISQLVRWLLNKKIKDINDINKLEKNPQKAIENEESTEEWNKLMKEVDE